MSQLYRKKPVVIEAVQYTEDNIAEVLTFIGKSAEWGDNTGLTIKTLEGAMSASLGDYIIKGVSGEFYPCKPDIFNKTYEVYE